MIFNHPLEIFALLKENSLKRRSPSVNFQEIFPQSQTADKMAGAWIKNKSFFQIHTPSPVPCCFAVYLLKVH